jgi:hypothetical protein
VNIDVPLGVIFLDIRQLSGLPAGALGLLRERIALVVRSARDVFEHGSSSFGAHESKTHWPVALDARRFLEERRRRVLALERRGCPLRRRMGARDHRRV